MDIMEIMEEMIKYFGSALVKMNLWELIITFLVIVIVCSMPMMLAFEFADRPSKSANNEKERNILQDKDNDKN